MGNSTRNRPLNANRLSLDVTAASIESTSCELPQDLPIDVWCRIGVQLSAVSEASCWWIGDWLVYGELNYPLRYRRAMTETSLDYQTLRNYAWVARKFAPSRRRVDLSFQHHVEVAALSEEEQDHWLDFAERFGWSRNELRRQIKASYEDQSDAYAFSESKRVQVSLQVSADRVERWKQAAASSNRSLPEWIANVLDQVTSSNGTR
jgi:hypothetical protein